MAEKRGSLGKKKSKSAKKKSSGKHPHEIHIRRAKSGELLAKHIHKADGAGMPPPDEEHVIPQGGLDDHVDEHMPPQPEEAQGAPAPQPGGMMGGGM